MYGEVILKNDSLECLSPGQFLNDEILNWWTKSSTHTASAYSRIIEKEFSQTRDIIYAGIFATQLEQYTSRGESTHDIVGETA